MTELQVRTAELLYRTRGRDWDYAFLLQPAPLLGEGWYGLHRRIFANVEPGAVPCLLRGALAVGVGQPFFATAFLDQELRDYQARPIAHYLAWLGHAADAAPGLSYGPALVRLLRPALDAVFELVPEVLQRGETKPLDTLIRGRFLAALGAQELRVEGEPGQPIRWLGSVAV